MPENSSSQVYYALHQIKKVQRCGWCHRGPTSDLNTTERTFGAYMTGLLFLPNESNALGYSKPSILQMLLCQDVVEAITMDPFPYYNPHTSQHQEAQTLDELATRGTYERSTSTLIERLCAELNDEQSTNVQIAHELALIDNLTELWKFQSQGDNILDCKEWESKLRAGIKTDIGLRILHDLEKHYHAQPCDQPSGSNNVAGAPPP